MPVPVQAGLPTPQAPESGEPPMGTSPATSPTPNAGDEAQAAQQASLILDAATELLPKVGISTPIGKLLHEFIGKALKVIQPGAVSPAGKQNQMDTMQRQNAQNGQNLSMVRAGAGQSQDQQPGQAA